MLESRSRVEWLIHFGVQRNECRGMGLLSSFVVRGSSDCNCDLPVFIVVRMQGNVAMLQKCVCVCVCRHIQLLVHFACAANGENVNNCTSTCVQRR